METLALPERILSLSAGAAERLISAGNGDAALFDLALLRHGETTAARQSLGWTDPRCTAALEELVRLGLARGNVEQAAAPAPSDEPPDYQRSDLRPSPTTGSLFSCYQRFLNFTGSSQLLLAVW